MKSVFNKLAAFAAAALLAASANASLIIDGGIVGSTGLGGANDVIPGKSGIYNGNLKVDVDSIVTFTLVGYEAGWNNYLRTTQNGGFIYNKGGAGQTFSVFASAGSYVDFFFETFKNANFIGNVYNGSNNIDGSGKLNFWLGSADILGGVWLALDDTGFSIDDNHDDLVILATARAVPEPASLALLGIGALGLVAQRRRNRN